VPGCRVARNLPAGFFFGLVDVVRGIAPITGHRASKYRHRSPSSTTCPPATGTVRTALMQRLQTAQGVKRQPRSRIRASRPIALSSMRANGSKAGVYDGRDSSGWFGKKTLCSVPGAAAPCGSSHVSPSRRLSTGYSGTSGSSTPTRRLRVHGPTPGITPDPAICAS